MSRSVLQSCVVVVRDERTFSVSRRHVGDFPPEALCGGISKVNFQETLSSFGDKCPQNGSKNEEMAPRTRTGYPHIGPSVERPCTVSKDMRDPKLCLGLSGLTNLEDEGSLPI